MQQLAMSFVRARHYQSHGLKAHELKSHGPQGAGAAPGLVDDRQLLGSD